MSRPLLIGCGVLAALSLLCGCGGVLSYLFLNEQGRRQGQQIACAAGIETACALEMPTPHETPLAEPSPPPPPPPPPSPPGPVKPARAKERQRPVRSIEGGIPAAAVRVGGNIPEPTRLAGDRPVYPEIARQARVQGVVILEATISPQGRVVDVKVLRGIPLLDQAAIDAVRTWVYTPTLLNGVPVALIMTVTVNFTLQ